MNTLTLHEEIVLPCPEGFRALDEKEQANFNITEQGEGVCLQNIQQHIIISVGRKQLNTLTATLLNSDDVAKNMERVITLPMKKFGFQLEKHIKKQFGGQNATGFTYRYIADNIPMYAESYVVKYKKVLYYFHFYAHAALLDESLAVWEQFFTETKWI